MPVFRRGGGNLLPGTDHQLLNFTLLPSLVVTEDCSHSTADLTLWHGLHTDHFVWPMEIRDSSGQLKCRHGVQYFLLRR